MDRGGQWATVHRITRVSHDLDTKPPTPRLFIYLYIHIFLLHHWHILGPQQEIEPLPHVVEGLNH